MSIRMIATDIDGTMLRSNGTLSDRVHRALHRAHQSGIHVVPATGRPFVVSTDVIEALRLDQYWVFANGAVTRHLGRDELIRGVWMDPMVAQGLVVELRAAVPGAGFALEMERDVAFEAGFENVVPTAPNIAPLDDVLDGIRGRVQKVLVFHPEMSIDELRTLVVNNIGDRGVAAYSGLPMIEVSSTLVTKATALEALSRDLGVSCNEVATFGDNHNDVAMLKWAGRGYAMGNATDDVQQVADEVIGHCDDDGLAVKVEELIEEFTA